VEPQLLLSVKQRARVQSDTGVSQETIRKFERGARVSSGVMYALERSFRRFGYHMPKRPE
jgi:hypothetical protein